MVLSLVLSGLASYAQWGVSAGLGVADLVIKDNDDIGDIVAGFSFQLGGSYEAEISDMVSIQPALRFTYNSSKTSGNDKIKLMYVNLPVDVKVYFLDVGDMRLYGLGGPYLGYMLSAKVNAHKLTIGGSNNDDQTPLDAGLRFGAGIQMFDALNIDMAYDLGIANISGKGTRDNGYTEMNRAFRITATYQFW